MRRRERLLLRLCVAAAAALVASISGGAERAGATTDHHAAAAVIAYGYPYARDCPDAGYTDAVDRWGMYECNCTSYVAWALNANRRRTDWFVPGEMDARNWARVAERREIPVGRTPRAGAVAVWPKLSPPFGHVALVTGVDRDGHFDVAEYNYPAVGWFVPYVFDVRRDVSRSGAVFVYVPRRTG